MARRKTKTSTGLSNPKAKVNVSITPQSKSTLEKIVNEIELTKSAFFEGILDGSISLASPEAKKSVNLKFDETTENNEDNQSLIVEVFDDSSLNKEQKKSDSNLENNPTSDQQKKIAELEKQVEQLQNNLQEKDQENQSLEVKIAEFSLIGESFKKDLQIAKDKTENNHQRITDLEKLNDEKQETIDNLNKQIEQSVSKSKLEQEENQQKTKQQITDLEKSNQEKQTIIDNLNQEINQLKEDTINKQNEETSLVNKSTQLTQEIEKKDNLIAQSKQQISSQNEQIRQLQTRINQITANHSQSFASLQKTSQEQQNTIISLKKKIAELESVASIGNQTLNKWRNKMYR